MTSPRLHPAASDSAPSTEPIQPTALASDHAPTRREDDRLLRGAGCYVHDVQVAGRLAGVFVRSPVAHGRLQGASCHEALAVPGVVAVLGVAELGRHGMPAPNPLLPVAPDASGQPFPLLAEHHVQYLGQPVLLVVAVTEAAAQQGAAAVQLHIEPLAARLDFDKTHPSVATTVSRQATAPDPATVSPTASFSTRTSDFQSDTPADSPSDTPNSITVEVELISPRVLAMTMEPRATVAQWDAQAQHLTVWLGTQTPSRAQADIAATCALALEQVRVVAPDVGGAFGAKASVSPEDLVVALAACHLKAAIGWYASRSEEFIAGMHGRGSHNTAQLQLSAQGQFQKVSAQLHFTAGAWLPYSGVVPLLNAARILPGPYRCPGLDVQGLTALAHAAPVTIYRGAGRPEAALIMETLVDKAARRLGIDPVQLRLANLVSAADMPYATPSGELLDSGDYEKALQLACQAFGYEQQRAEQATRRANGQWVGLGVALYIEPCGKGWESATVTLHADGGATVATGTPAQGQGRLTTFAQIAATVLGVPAQSITVVAGDTGTCPQGTGALASRSTAIGGSAVVQACQQALALRQQGQPYPIEVTTRFTSPEAWSYGCVMVKMVIDGHTGQPTLEQVVWADDAGQIINPTLAKGQLLGGAAQGIGQALMERLVYDDTGQLITGSLMDYAIPRASDMPPIHIVSLCTPSPHNLLGAKGVGEAGCIGLPAAIMNAAYDALQAGPDLQLHFPLSAEQLWRALCQPVTTT